MTTMTRPFYLILPDPATLVKVTNYESTEEIIISCKINLVE